MSEAPRRFSSCKKPDNESSGREDLWDARNGPRAPDAQRGILSDRQKLLPSVRWSPFFAVQRVKDIYPRHLARTTHAGGRPRPLVGRRDCAQGVPPVPPSLRVIIWLRRGTKRAEQQQRGINGDEPQIPVSRRHDRGLLRPSTT